MVSPSLFLPHKMSDSESENNTNNKIGSPTGDVSSKVTQTSSKTEFHPALAVSNIKNHIPIVLEMEKDQYGTWAKLFHIHARSH